MDVSNKLKPMEVQRDEMIEEIILRLPPPAVARFRCVSTGWRRRLSEVSFAERYQARNVLLLGFFHQRSCKTSVFTAIPSNFPPDISTGLLPRTGTPFHCQTDDTLAVVNSSNGLLLFYCSKPSPRYVVMNPIAGDTVIVNVMYDFENLAERFMVFGFAFDPYCKNPYFTIVEVSNSALRSDCVQVQAYSSISPPDTILHKLPAYLRDNYALSGPSTFYRGALHWLLEPSGVVAYDIRAKTMSFSLINIPGDENYLDGSGLCRCVKKMRVSGSYSNGDCSCRYLGESRDRLIYIRVTGDSQFSLWTLEHGGIWSLTSHVVVDNLPASLSFGRVLAFDRIEPRLLFLRVRKKFFSYNCDNQELKELCEIRKDYGGEENCLGFMFPYELPRITLSIPNYTHTPIGTSDSGGKRPHDAIAFANIYNAVKHLRANPSVITEDMLVHPKQKSFLKKMKKLRCRFNDDDGLLHLYNQCGITQVAAKYFPHPQSVESDATKPPMWSSYNLCAPFTADGIRGVVVNFNDFLRVEACLYGCTAERGNSSY